MYIYAFRCMYVHSYAHTYICIDIIRSYNTCTYNLCMHICMYVHVHIIYVCM